MPKVVKWKCKKCEKRAEARRKRAEERRKK